MTDGVPEKDTSSFQHPLDLQDLEKEGIIEPVFLASGLHNPFDREADLANLPRRFEAGNPKSRISWFGALCIAGIGMFVEAYIVITTGQVKTVWKAEYPTCWSPTHKQVCPNNIGCCGLFPKTPTINGTCAPNDLYSEQCDADGTYSSDYICRQRVLDSISYAEFAGIMAGMVLFGQFIDLFGLGKAGLLTSLCVIAGVGVMSFNYNEDQDTLFLVFAVFFAVMGFGMGGEYPVTATRAANVHVQMKEEARYDNAERKRLRLEADHVATARRGETISIAFAMQGVGAVVGSVVLLCLIFFAGQTETQCHAVGANSAGVIPRALEGVWRTFYFIGMLFVIMVFLFRSLVLEEENPNKQLIGKTSRMGLFKTFEVLGFYFFRLLGTGGTWLVWDVSFYGLKLFSGPIFSAINPSGSLLKLNGYLLVNNLCALAGYYCAAAVIDHPKIGRVKLQMFSFAMLTILFGITAAQWGSASPQTLMTLYFMSSYFGNFGANVTTYVMAAETYPTEVRGTCHGLSAFLGKVGALIATKRFSKISTDEIFKICSGVSVVGFFCTLLFSCDLTLVSLAEHDAQFELWFEGNAKKYKGKLNAPEHLSLWERMTGSHGEYDPKWLHALINERASKHSMHALTDQSDTKSPRSASDDVVDETMADL